MRRIPIRLVCFPAVYLDMTRMGKTTKRKPGPESPGPEKSNTRRFQGSKKMERKRRGFGVWVITCGRDATHRFPPIPEIVQCAIPGSHQINPRQRGNLGKDLAVV